MFPAGHRRRTAPRALFPVAQRRLSACQLVVVGRTPEQKIEPAEETASGNDKACKKQHRL
jgi:hypothetical protein